MTVQDEYIDRLNKIIESTKQGKIEWKQSTASTFFWATKDPLGKTTHVNIQRTISSRQKEGYYYIFSIVVGGKEIISKLFGTIDQNPILYDKLFELYTEVDRSIKQKGLDLFDFILKDN